MDKEYAKELEVQGAVKSYLRVVDNDETYNFKNLRAQDMPGAYAALCSEARSTITAVKEQLQQEDKSFISSFGGGYVSPEKESTTEETLAQTIETQAAVTAFFQYGDSRPYRFLSSTDFFRAYAMMSEAATSTLKDEVESAIIHDINASQFIGHSVNKTPLETRRPTSPSTEETVKEATAIYLQQGETNYKILPEEDFFKAYAKISYGARRYAVEQQSTSLDSMFTAEQPVATSAASQFK